MLTDISESSGSENWIDSHKKKDPKELLSWLIGERDSINHHYDYVEPNGVDGFYNNPFRPELGAVGIIYILNTFLYFQYRNPCMYD